MSYNKINPAPHTTWQYTPMAIRYDEKLIAERRKAIVAKRVARRARKRAAA